MHEMSLCEGIRQILEERAGRDGFRAVQRVRLEIGRFAAVEIEALRFGFDVVMKGSIADGAVLDILDRPGEAYCYECEKAVTIEDRLDPCPFCGGGRLLVTGGNEMRIKDLEVV